MNQATAKCLRCGCVRVSHNGVLAEVCPMCAARTAALKQAIASKKIPPFKRDALLRPLADMNLPGKQIAIMLTAAVVIAAVVFGIFRSVPDESNLSSGNRRYNDNWYRIRDACRTAIGSQLHDLSSAEWGDESPYEQGNTFVIQYELRAKNGFGAYRLTKMTCVVNKDTLKVLYALPGG